MANYRIIDENSRSIVTYKEVDEVVVDHYLVRLFDSYGQLIAIVHLAPGDRLEKEVK